MAVPREAPYHRFDDFIAPGADRFGFLCEILGQMRFPYSVLPLGTQRHFLVYPEQRPFPGLKPSLVLVAHYDRVAGSPGANDNSAAVFMLLETMMKTRERNVRDWFIIFTDKEELSHGEGIQDQGSYTLAKNLRETGLRQGRFYIFDACGSGDTLIISTMADHLMKNETGQGSLRARHDVKALRDRALECARNLAMDRVLLVPTPFSDDAGFLRAGLAAQTITVLPGPEASSLASLLRAKPELTDALVSREAHDARLLLPATWRRLNGPDDTSGRLTPQHFKRVVKFACELCGG
jgi:hypothetical protein